MVEMLSKEEATTLQAFRDLFRGRLDEKRLSDNVFLLRWLSARDFDLVRAELMLQEFLDWRRRENIDDLLHEPVFPPDYFQRYPWYIQGKDKDGRPVFVLEFGRWDIRGACEKGEKDLLVKWMDYGYEAGGLASSRSPWLSDPNKFHSQVIVIVDYEGFSFSQLLNKQAIESMLQVVHHFDNYYPETMHRGFIVNAPPVFSILWNLMKPLLPAKTLSKISLNGTNKDEWTPILQEYIEPHQLSPAYGGTLLVQPHQFTKI